MPTSPSSWMCSGPAGSPWAPAPRSSRRRSRSTRMPRHALAVSSGTAALHLMCLAAGIGPGDEVIVPSLTFVATVNAVRYCGATPVFAEIAGITRAVAVRRGCRGRASRREPARSCTSPSAAIPATLGELAAIASRHDVALLLDAAHAVGTRLDGRQLGSYVLGAAHSFFSNKNLAVGEGGMVVTDDDALADACTSAALPRHDDAHLGSPPGTRLRATTSSTSASTTGSTSPALHWEPRGSRGSTPRTRAARRSPTATGPRSTGTCDLRCRRRPARRSANHLFAIVLEPGADRAAFRAALADRGVQTSVHYPAVHRVRDLPRRRCPTCPSPRTTPTYRDAAALRASDA